MSIVNRLVNAVKGLRSSRALPDWDDYWYDRPFGLGAETLAGTNVDQDSALTLSTVYRCVRILSDSIASLPIYLYEKQADGSRRRATERIINKVLNQQANEEMSSYILKQVIMGHLLAWGNFYGYVARNARNVRNAIIPLNPSLMTVRRNDRTSELQYLFTPQKAGPIIFTPSEILHLKNFSYSGLVGRSVITAAKEGIGLAQSQQEYSSRFYSGGTHPGLVATTPKVLKDTTAKNLKDALLSEVGGLGKSHRLLLLQEDLKLSNISINPVDAQFLESRSFQVLEICRFFGIPPHMVADLQRSIKSNIEHEGIGFTVHTLGPWLSLIESELAKFFLTPDERNHFYFEFNVNKFLRGDIKTRFAAYHQGVMVGGYLPTTSGNGNR